MGFSTESSHVVREPTASSRRDCTTLQGQEATTWARANSDEIVAGARPAVTNTKRQPAYDLVHRLSQAGVKLNVTAIMGLDQVRDAVAALKGGAPSNVSVFAGRIADTGRDRVPHMAAAMEFLKLEPKAELTWASPRELLNVFQAHAIGCHIIAVTHDILSKLSNVGKNLDDFSLDTVKMFYNDAQKAGFAL